MPRRLFTISRILENSKIDSKLSGKKREVRALAPTIKPLLVWIALLSATLCRAEPRFTDATQAAGLAFRNWYGNNNALTILETTGSGAAFFDFDNDGLLDLYIVNGGLGFDGPRYADLPRDVLPPANGEIPRNALFRNQGDGTFADISQQAGVGASGWGVGCVVGDYDNDGDGDLYITYYGSNRLFANQGDGTFTDISQQAGVDDGRYGTACAFGDWDNDGDLDLFAGNYVAFDPATTLLPGEQRDGFFGGQRGIASVASPEAFAAEPDILYRNQGDSTFEDISQQAGLNQTLGKTLGATFIDWNDDGAVDLYVANDATPNFLYTNQGDGTFAEEALALGVAYDGDGQAEGSMGLAAGDWDNDGDLDLAVSNYEGQTATLHRNDGASFSNISFAAGVARTTLMPLQWGTALFDWDRDGDLDLFIANGHVTAALEDFFPQSSYAQRNNLFRNDGGTFPDGDPRFVDVSARAGPGLQLVKSSRGTAVGDYDSDGDEDLFVVDKNEIPTLLRNDTAVEHHWLAVRTLGVASNRDGIGARMRLVAGGQQQLREVNAGSNYLSHNSLWITFGLGQRTLADTLEIRWPSGQLDQYTQVAGDRFIRVEEGKGMTSVIPD